VKRASLVFAVFECPLCPANRYHPLEIMSTTTFPTSSFVSVGAAAAPSPTWWRPAISLCQRELVRFLRQRHRVIGSLATPIMFWLFLGLGMSRSFRGQGQTAGGGFMEYFFAGTILMILLFTAIFSTISIIEDRREGFLQSVLVAPVSRMSIVLGKVLGGTVLAFGQAVLFLLLAPLAGIHLTLPGVAGALAIMLVLAFSLTALGFCIAWRMSSTQGFHVIMNLFLLPMWMLSGALFPIAGAAAVAQIVMRLDPLTYGLAGLRRCLYWNEPSVAAGGLGYGPCLLISIAFAVVLFVLASFIARKRVSADLV
jgi:ABC-2 type transport system permease protein